MVIAHMTGLITPLITAHEPPSRVLFDASFEGLEDL